MKRSTLKHIVFTVGAAAATTGIGYLNHFIMAPIWPENAVISHEFHGRAIPTATIIAGVLGYWLYVFSGWLAAHPAWTTRSPEDHAPPTPQQETRKPGRNK